jgi:hypothetical protein
LTGDWKILTGDKRQLPGLDGIEFERYLVNKLKIKIMKKLILLTLGAAAAYKVAKHYNVTLDDVKKLVLPLTKK